MANASYYNNSARKKDHEKKMQEALEARKKRTSSSSGSSVAEKKKAHDQKIQAALDARSERIRVSLPDVMADIQKQVNAEIDSYNRNTKKPAFGAFEETFKNQSDSRRNISALRSTVEAYRSYIGDSVADSIISALDRMKSGYESHLALSQFKDEDDYNFVVTHSTPEKRQAWYQDQQTQIDELSNFYDNYHSTDLMYREYRANPAAFTQEEANDIIANYEKHDAFKKKYGINTLYDVEDKISAIEAEMRNYERGNYNENGRFYGSKVDDDHYWVTQQPDFAITSTKRDYKNPTREDFQQHDAYTDSSTWYVDANNVYRDAYGNALEVDKSGNWVNPKAKGFRVEDKLGLYLSATDEDLEEAAGTTVGSEGSWASIIKDGMDGSWKYLEEDEKGIYYTYLGESQEKAYQYLDDMKTELNRRQTLDELGQWDKGYDEANLLEKIAMNAATVPTKFISNVAGSIENAAYTLAGEDINPYSAAQSGMHFSQSVRGNTAEELDETNLKIPVIDFTLGDIYQTGMSRLDSALATGVFGGGGTVFLGMGATQEEAYRLYQQGASAEQITLGAFSAGAAEAVFEYVSFDKLVNMGDADTIFKWVKNALIQGGIEASEETFTEISNIITNAVIMGQQSDLTKLYEESGGDWFKTGLSLVKQAAQAAFGGFIGGFGAGATQATSQYADAMAQYSQTGNTIRSADGGAKALENLAMDVAGATEGKLSNSIKKQAGKVSGEVATGKGIGKIGAAVKNFSRDVQAGRLHNTVQTANNALNKADVATILEMRRFDSGLANELADAIVAVASGNQITEQQAELLKEYKNNEDVMGVINGYDLDERSTIGKRNKAMSEFNRDIKTGLVVAELKNTTEKAFTPDGKFKVSKTGEATKLETEVDVKGKTITKDTGEVISIKGVYDVRKVEVDGKEKVELILELTDGTTINAENVAYATKNDALIYDAISILGDNIDAKTANRIISKYDGSDALVFSRGMAQAYSYGFYGIDRSEMTGRLSLATELTEAQRNFAYGLGEKYRAEKDARDKANAKDDLAKNIKEGKVKAPGEKGLYYRDKNGNTVSMDDYLKNSNVVLKNDVQKTGLEAMRRLSETLGVRINVFESWKENGKTYYLNQFGKKTEGNPNGFYDTLTGEIYIALDAGSDFSGTMLFTVAHELTHQMRQWSPEHFTQIAKIVFAQSGFKGDVGAMIALKQKNAEAKGKPISYDVAMEEVVADAMETILKDGKVFEFMQELKQQNRTAWEKAKAWLKNLAKFLRKMVVAYSGKYANTEEGRRAAAFAKETLEQIERIWAEGAVSAGDTYRAAQEQFSTDTIRGNADGAVVKNETTEALTALESPRTEYEALPKQMMNLSDGAGTILSFIEGLTPTEVKGLSSKGINGYTGRAVRGYAMGISGFTQAQIKEVNKFMDTMADFMEEAGVTYKFIGLQDVENAQLHYTYNADGSIKSIVLSAMVKNGDYPVNFDLSSICKKRVAMSALIDKLARRGSLDSGTVKLTPANIFKINTALKDAGYETACLGCFVESKRYNSLEWAKKFCDKWNAVVKKVNPNATYFGYGDATFNEDSFTLEQAIKIDDAANRYIKATKTERLANALAKYRAKEQAGLPLVAGKVMKVDGEELNTFSKAARDRLAKSETISDELKNKYLTCDVSTLNMADVEFLLENGILPGAALTNKQAVTEMVKSGEAYQHLLRPSDLLTDRGISKLEALPNFHGVLYGHYGSGTPKLMQSYTPYNSEIALLPASKGEQSLAEYLYTIAGVRMQSFSDFQIQNIYDYLQMVGDLAARKVPAHAYTKEISFAKLLGMTGIKVNLSVMFDIDPMVDKAHAGLTKLNKLVHRGEYAKVVLEDEQGRWVYNIGDYQTQRMFAEAFPDEAKRFLQSIGFADAVKLQTSTGYSANCGIIGVGYSDLGIFAMLDDNRIRYIIPYHASSLPADIKVATHIELGTDYTPYQNNMKIKEIVDRNGNKVNWTIKEAYKRLGSGQAVIDELNEKIRSEGWVVSTTKAQNGHGSYGLYEDLQQTNDPRQTASNFMDWCIGNSTLPLFYQFASHENYYKLLYDYNVYDCVTEEYAPQQAVTNTYPTMVDGQVQPGTVTDGSFDAEYLKGTIDKQMAFMNEYSRNLDEDLDALAENMEKGALFSDRQAGTQNEVVRFSQRKFNKAVDDIVHSDDNAPFDYRNVYMGETPQVLLDIGFIQLPMTITSKHIYTIANKDGRFTGDDDHYHNLGATRVMELPEMLKNPVATFVEKDNPRRVVIVTSKVDASGKPIMVSVEYSGQTRYQTATNEVQIYANPVTTALGKKDSWFASQIAEAIRDGRMLQADKKRSQESPSGVWSQCPESLWSTDFTANINLFKQNVKRFLPKEKQIRKSWNAVRASEGTSKMSDRDNAPTFYSQMAKVVDGLKDGKYGAASLVSTLTNRGVKAEEIKWSGIETWLEGKKSVTKAELQEFIAGSMLRVEEQGTDGTIKYTTEQKERRDELSETYGNLWESADQYWFGLFGDWLPYEVYSATDGPDIIRNTVMESGDNESESGKKLLKLADDIDQIKQDIADLEDEAKKQNKLTRWEEYSLDGGENYREFIFRLPGSSYTNHAMQVHWGSSAMGILAHARVQDFDVNGNKMLFIEEIQSDWHNEGHAKGYESAEYKEAERISDELFNEWQKVRKPFHQYVRSSEFNTDPEDVRKKKFDWLRSKVEAAEKKWQEAERYVESLREKGAGTVPNAPFKDTYHEYVLKRLIRMAAEEGYDSIGWTPAEIQVDRWSEAYAEGYRIEYDQDIPKFLNKYGKKWGAKVGKAELFTGNSEMYSEDVERVRRAIASWERDLALADTDSERSFIQEQIAYHRAELDSQRYQSYTEVWSMDITPAMKESVMTEGQPLYSDRILMGSLFSGGGTLEAGLAYQMLDKQFGVEYDGRIAAVYAQNHGDHIQVGKVEDFDISKYDDIFYLHASPVCHNFSKAKHGAKELQMDIDSAKATAKHLETAMPQVFTVENAPGYRKSESLKIITDKLTELGYKWDVDVYNSADYGSATSRNRVILRAVKDGELPPKPTKQERTNSWDKVTRDLWDTLPKATLRPSFISAIENTRNLPILDANGKVNVNKPLLILTTTSGHMVTYCWEGDICPTLTTKCGEARLVMPDGNIYSVTPEFMGRIQGLPDDYKYPKEKTRAFTIIGNGIPTHLTKAVVGGVLDSAYEQTHDGQVLYQDRADDSVSNRALLANAFEGIAKPEELPKIQEYKDKVALINAEEKKLREINEQIKELSFAKGPRDNKRIKALRFDAVQAANRINTYDKQLLRLEASEPLQKVLNREKRLAYKKAEQRGKEALADYKAKVEAQQKETAEKWRESRKTAVAKARETAEKRDARAKLQKLVLDTVKWISYPAKTDVKCPDILKKPYEAFLQGIDLSSKRLANGGEATKNDLRLANAMDSLATAIDRVMLSQDPSQDVDKVLDIGYLDLPADFVQKLRDMTESIKSMMVEGEYVVNTMTAEEVRKLSQMIRTLNHAIKTMSKLYANLRFANVEALGFDTMDFLDAVGEIEKTGGMKDFVQWDNSLPFYAFKRFGKGGESIFEGLMDAQDKLAFLAQGIFDFQEKTWTGKEAKAWSEDTHTITLPNGTELTLTTADAMSIYCLSRREQALPHLLGGGVRVMGIQKGSQKAKDSRSLLTIEDVQAIISSLTDRQRQVAEGIQEFMSTVCSEWGNEISMKRFLTREFTEKFYFPIESNDENLTVKDPAAQQSDLFRLLNISATKPLTQGANNEVIIRNIFDVFTGHASDMARLNAYGMGLLDYMKWLNYREKTSNDEGQIKVRGVRKSMEKAYGKAANSYVLNLIKDVNGRPSDGGDPNILMKWMRSAKTASVGSSARVATLQITSYPRAALVLSPKSLSLGLTKVPNISRAKKYCGIALWKSFGFYDTNISRSIEDQMKGVKDVKQKLIELSLKGAEWGDAITWGALWNACEYEVAKTTTNKVGSEEFYQEVGKKLREVVYRTQVVDSSLTRSQIMRSKRGMAQEAAAFMSEPTLSANILMDAGFEFSLEKRRTGSAKSAWSKTGAYIGRAIAVYSIGQLTAALMEGLWDAWRDEDDEEFWKKYLSAFAENLALDLVPFNKLPIVSDVFEGALSIFGVGFYSSDKMSTTWLTQAVSAVDAWKDVFGGNSSATVYNALYKTLRAVSSFYGVSFSGVMREGVALWNNTAGAFDPMLKILTYDRSKAELGDMLLDALIAGDDRQADSIRGKFADEEGSQSALRTAIKDRLESGDIDSGTANQYLVNYGGVKVADAYWMVKEWSFNGDAGDDFGKYDSFYTAVETGKDLKAVIKEYTDNGVTVETLKTQITEHFKPLYIEMSNSEKAGIKGYLLNAMTVLGMEREDAEEKVQEWEFESKYGFSYSDRAEAYKSGKISANELKTILMDVGGKTAEEADLQIEAYNWEKDGYEDVTMAAVREYNEHCAASDVPKDVYLHIRSFANDTENDKDANGKTIYYSAMRKIMAEIDEQYGLTASQKTAIARSLGWAEKNISKYKLW